RQRRRAGADAGHALAVLLGRDLGEAGRDVAAQVGGHALEAADGDRFVVDAAAAARRLARPAARAPEDAGEHVALTVEHVRVRVAALRDEADVLGDVRVRRAGPLAIHHAVEVARVVNVGR